MPCHAADLAEVKLFELLDAEELGELAAVVDAVDLEAGKILFHAGDAGECLYIIKSGEIEIYVQDTTGQKIILKVSGAGEVFGEIAMLDNRPRSATALALTNAKLFALDREDLLLLFRRKPVVGLNMLASVTTMLREADNLLRMRAARNVNEEMEETMSPLERVADWIAWFSGSIQFLALNGIWFGLWIVVNILPTGFPQFDPFPFGLLTMIVSLESIFLACFVLLSQNRQVEKDRIRSDIEYEVNVKAEMEIAHLHEKTDRLHEQMLEKFAALEKTLKSRKD